MSDAFLIELVLKSFVTAAAALVALKLLARRSAAERSLVGLAALLVLLALPFAAAGLPRLAVAPPAEIAPLVEAAAPFQPAAGPASAAVPAPAPVDLGLALRLLYLAGVAVLSARLATGLFRLSRWTAGTTPILDGPWAVELARLGGAFRWGRRARLLLSVQAPAPMSWGLLRPVVIIDPATYADPASARAVLSHELAHIARADWPALILGRVASILFWFNPLVWRLAAVRGEAAELAADDRVLGRVEQVRYAETLLAAARRHCSPTALPAHCMVAGRSELARRLDAVLDQGRRRAAAGPAWAAGAVIAALALASPVAAIGLARDAVQGLPGDRAVAELRSLNEPHVGALAQAMAAGDYAGRRGGLPGPFKVRRAIAPLQLALTDPRPAVRRLALWGLSEMRYPETAPAAGRMLEDPKPEVRAAAARALGDIGRPGYAGRIAVLLDDRDRQVRLDALHALGDLRDPAARPALERARTDLDPAVAGKARWALRQVEEAEEVLSRYGR